MKWKANFQFEKLKYWPLIPVDAEQALPDLAALQSQATKLKRIAARSYNMSWRSYSRGLKT